MTTIKIFIALTTLFLLSINIHGQNTNTQSIYFQNKETELNPSNIDVLDSFIDSVEIATNCKIKITGYSDNVGNEKLNYSISEKRANSVKNYFITKGLMADSIIAMASGPVLDPNKNKSENEKQLNRRVEIVVSCITKNKEDGKLVIASNPNFENDTIIKGLGGTVIKIKKGAFYPRKIKDVAIEIKELRGYCDSLPDDIEMATENGVCLESGGMAFISVTYKKKPVKKSFDNAFEVKIPILNNDTTMDFYIAVRPKKGGKLRWKKVDGKIINEGGEKFYVYETNFLGGFNCDKVVGNCNLDSILKGKGVYKIKTWVKFPRAKYYIKDKFAFYNAPLISKRKISIPSGINPNDIYIEINGYKAFSFRHYRNKMATGLYETKQVYTLSDFKYNSRKKQYKLKAKNFKPQVSKTQGVKDKGRQIKEKMGCN